MECRLEKNISICRGAQIMINQNLNTDIGLSNGTMGKIHDIVKNKSGKIYEFFQNREKISILKLNYS